MLFWLFIVIIIFGIAFRRNSNHRYRFGSGLYKSSEDNIEEKDDFVDKDYYDSDGLMK